MTITLGARSQSTVDVDGKGFTNVLDAVSAAAKAAGYVARGGRYLDENGEPTGLTRAEAALIFRGYRWIAPGPDGRFYVTV